MKRSLLFMMVFSFTISVYSQVGIGTSDPQAALEISSGSQGFLMPRMTSPPTFPAAPVEGTLYYNSSSSSHKFEYYNGTSWVAFPTASGSTYTASNGLTMTSTNVTLGGALTANTTVGSAANNTLTLQSNAGTVVVGGSATDDVLTVNGTSTFNAPVFFTTYVKPADANYTVQATDVIIDMSNQTANRTVTLPDPTENVGRLLFIFSSKGQGVDLVPAGFLVPNSSTPLFGGVGVILIGTLAGWANVIGA